MTLKFYVKNQTLIYNIKQKIASGSKNYLYADFKFSNEWSGLSKTAVFVSGDKTLRYHMLLKDGRCTVPAEVIQSDGFYVSVFGGNRITSSQVYINTVQSGITPGLTPPEPTQDVYEQLMDKVDNMNSKLESMVFEYPSDAVTEKMIKNGAVTSQKLAPNTVTTAKIADSSVTLAKLDNETKQRFHTHENMYQLSLINQNFVLNTKSMIDERKRISERPISITDLEHPDIGGWYVLNYNKGEMFEIYNNTEESVKKLAHNDSVYWEFTEPLEPEESYLVRIIKMPYWSVDENTNGQVEVLRKTLCGMYDAGEKLYDAVNELYAEIADAARSFTDLL